MSREFSDHQIVRALKLVAAHGDHLRLPFMEALVRGGSVTGEDDGYGACSRDDVLTAFKASPAEEERLDSLLSGPNVWGTS